MKVKASLLLLSIFLALAAWAQESASFRLTDGTLNAGGRPSGGAIAVSASFRVSLDALGQAGVATGLSSHSFEADAGFVASFPPPGEVAALRFTGSTTLAWDPEYSVGSYALYRGLISHPFDPAYGGCGPPVPIGETVEDPDLPPAAGCFFYLVTARNRLGEEGTKGFDGTDAERSNPHPCP